MSLDLRPDVCYVYNGTVTSEERVSEILYHFDGDVDDIPDFSTLYLEEPRQAGQSGHRGPFNPAVSIRQLPEQVFLISFGGNLYAIVFNRWTLL